MLVYFLCKNCNPLKKVTPFFPATPCKNCSTLPPHPPFPQQKGGWGGADYVPIQIMHEIQFLSSFKEKFVQAKKGYPIICNMLHYVVVTC